MYNVLLLLHFLKCLSIHFVGVCVMNRFVSVHLDRNSKKPLYSQLAEKIIEMINEDKFRPNEKLPAIRKMASNLGVNSVTIVNAYNLLEEQGWVLSKMGSGTYVSPAAILKNDIEMDFEEGKEQKTTIYRDEPYGDVKFDFARSSISPEFFPVEGFQRALNEVLERDRGYAFGYQESLGYLPLRESIVDFIKQEYGICSTVDEIQIVSGAQQGLDILSKALLGFKDTVFVEGPTYPGAINVFKSRGANIVEIPMEKDGIDMDFFCKKLKEATPKLFYTMPNFQNPTGVSYSMEKKKKLLELSSKYDFYIIEDDHVSDLYYDEKPVPLKTMDKNNRVFYVKGFSKLFMPGIRLAFLALPIGFSEKIAYAKYTSDIFSSGLFQRTMDLFFKKSLWSKHMGDMRRIFKDRWMMFQKSLEKEMPPEVRFNIPLGGLHFWFTMPKGFYSVNLYNKSKKRGVLLVPGDVFFSNHRPSSSFRLSFASIDTMDIEKSVTAFSKIVKDFLDEYPINPATDLGYRPIL